jgi:hypothetical protein
VTAELFVEAIPQIPHTAGQCRGASNEGLGLERSRGRALARPAVIGLDVGT